MISTQHADRAGNPISLREWAALYEHPSYRVVATSIVVAGSDPSHGFRVSTIWQGFDPDAPLWPLRPAPRRWFETAVLHSRRPAVIKEWRADTETGARRQHDHSVTWTGTLLDDPVVLRIPVVPARPRHGWSTPRRRETGTCQACRHTWLLTIAGTITTHGRSREGVYATCLGSLLPPAIPREE